MAFAYVTMVMCGDSYVQGALVLAASLKAVECKADLVVMVTSDVSRDARNALGSLFDRVELVNDFAMDVNQRYQPRFSDTHYVQEGPGSWLRRIFTKFHLFGLTDYDKVCWLDADMYAVACPDKLFSLSAPAGVCSSYQWEQDAQLHGCRIPREDIEASLVMPTFTGMGGKTMPYGIRGCTTLVAPSEVTRRQIFADLEALPEYGSRKLVVGPDEMFLTRLYADSWTHIHHKFACPAWKVDEFKQRTGEDPVLLHFVTDKPWNAKDWPDFQQWRATAADVARRFPATQRFFSTSVRRCAEFAMLRDSGLRDSDKTEQGAKPGRYKPPHARGNALDEGGRASSSHQRPTSPSSRYSSWRGETNNGVGRTGNGRVRGGSRNEEPHRSVPHSTGRW